MTIVDQYGRPVDPVPCRKPKIGFEAHLYLPNGELKAESPKSQQTPKEQA